MNQPALALRIASFAFFALLAAAVLLPGHAAANTSLTPFAQATDATPPAPWRVVTVPKIKAHTAYSVVALEGQRVLRIEADRSYANLLHPLDVALAERPMLRWRWRVESADHRGDLRRKEGDDVPARVCVLFDVPGDRLSAGVRLSLRLGRTLFDPELPAASICYVWDSAPGGLRADTWMPNAYTDRVQMLVVRSSASGASLGRWYDEVRDVAADFARAFPQEAAGGWLPRVSAVGVSADGDNTGARAVTLIERIALEPR